MASATSPPHPTKPDPQVPASAVVPVGHLCWGGCPAGPAQPHACGKGLPGPSASTMHRCRKGHTHTQTHRYTCRHDTVGVLLAPERVWKDGLSCSGPLRTFRENWRPVVLKPSWATTAMLAPACQEDFPDTRSSIGPGSALAGLSYSCGSPFPSSK